MRQIVLDTETTGIGEGHRIIEIGAVELIDRKLTGKHYHQYINPEREIDIGAQNVHGLSLQKLEQMNAPVFAQIADEFCHYIKGAELVIHNAPFDVGMMNQEFKRLKYPLTESFCQILDTLALARDMHPGARNSLDSLCTRYGIDNSHRTLHGALLDAEILADVYLLMTGGQTDLMLEINADMPSTAQALPDEQCAQAPAPAHLSPVFKASAKEQQAHDEFVALLDKKSGNNLWHKF